MKKRYGCCCPNPSLSSPLTAKMGNKTIETLSSVFKKGKLGRKKTTVELFGKCSFLYHALQLNISNFFLP